MLTKYATGEVIEVKSSLEPISGENRFASFEHLPPETYKTDEGYIYLKVRAISSRVNKNYDGWPVNELAGMDEEDFRHLCASVDPSNKTSSVFTATTIPSKEACGFKTFAARPFFVDHRNSDPRRARGLVVDTLLHIEQPAKYASDSYWATAPSNHTPETWVELLIELDADRFPKYAKAWREGKINSVSMGANVDHTICNICGNKASTVEEYCDHIRNKGKAFKSGGVYKTAYEDCVGCNFFEISGVFDPADVTALMSGDIIQKQAMLAPPPEEGGEKSNQEIWQPYFNEAYHLGQEFAKKSGFNSVEEMGEWHPLSGHWTRESPQELVLSPLGLHLEDDIPPQAIQMLMDAFENGFYDSMGAKEETNDLAVNIDASPSFEDHDFLNDLGIKWSSNRTNELMESGPTKFSKLGYDEFTTIKPKEIDLLKGEEPCKLDIPDCPYRKMGESICSMCSARVAKIAGDYDEEHKDFVYESLKPEDREQTPEDPPKELADPDLSKAKQIRNMVKEQKEEGNEEKSKLVQEISQKITKILSKNKLRSVNSQMKTDRLSHITLSSEADEVPSNEKLEALGWTLPGKDAGAAAQAVGIADKNKPASDRPSKEKVISDQKSPVESAVKTALGEKPGLEQPMGGESTPQYSTDFGTAGLEDHQPSTMSEQYSGIKHPVEAPQWSKEEEGKSDLAGIKEHSPGTQKEQYSEIKHPEEKPQFSDEYSKWNRESHVLSALKLAELEIDLGLGEEDDKYNRVAELEKEEPRVVEAQHKALTKAKEAGLSKKQASSQRVASFPSLKQASSESNDNSSLNSPDEFLFS